MFVAVLVALACNNPVIVAEPIIVPASSPPVCTNACPDYAPMWGAVCPPGERCITFHNGCTVPVALSYQIGCNGDGSRGAPQCSCTSGPLLAVGSSATATITDAAYTSCTPWTPACLTTGLAVTALYVEDGLEHDQEQRSCAGTRIEFSAGNTLDPYGRFDSYDVDIEKGFTVPVSYAPELACAIDYQNHDCRPLVCASGTCPDAYATPTTGGCPDGRSPQPGCQDTFANGTGYLVELCPAPLPASCQDATPCASR